MSRTLTGLLVGLMLAFSPVAASAQQKAADPAVLAKGEYLARAGDCIACHTAPEGALFAGGRAMPTPFGTSYREPPSTRAGRNSSRSQSA